MLYWVARCCKLVSLAYGHCRIGVVALLDHALGLRLPLLLLDWGAKWS